MSERVKAMMADNRERATREGMPMSDPITPDALRDFAAKNEVRIPHTASLLTAAAARIEALTVERDEARAALKIADVTFADRPDDLLAVLVEEHGAETVMARCAVACSNARRTEGNTR